METSHELLPVHGHEDERVDGDEGCDNDEELDSLAPGVTKWPLCN